MEPTVKIYTKYIQSRLPHPIIVTILQVDTINTMMSVAIVISVVYVVVILYFVYAVSVALNFMLDEIKSINRSLALSLEKTEAQDQVVIDVLHDVDCALRDNTSVMNTIVGGMHIETGNRKYDDSLEEDQWGSVHSL